MNELPELVDPDVAPLPDLADPDISSPAVTEKQQPGFMKKLDMINTGVHRGVTHFTHALMSKLPFGEKWQNAIKQADADIDAEQEYNKKTYSGYYPQGGEVAGELLATLPAGAPLGLAAKGATALGKLAPTGFKTLAKYGSSGIGGAGVLAGVESQRYDPENPGQLINTEAVKDTLTNPAAYIAPMVGTKLSTWGEASKALGEAKEVLPNIMARNLKEGASQKLSNQFFDSLGAITGYGKGIKLTEGLGDDLANFVTKISGQPEAMHAKDLVKYAGNQLQGALKVVKLKGDLMWEKPFKNAVVLDAQGVKDDVINAIDKIKNSGIPLESKTIKYLQEGMRKGTLTVEDVKNLQSHVGDAAINALKAGAGGTGLNMFKELKDVKDSLLNKIQSSIGDMDAKDFSAAREYSARQFKMYEEVPKLQKAIKNEVSARNLIRSVLQNSESVSKRGVLDVLPERGQKAVAAAKVAKAIEDSDDGAGNLNLGAFLKQTAESTQTPEIMGSDAYKSLQGLNAYLTNIHNASKSGSGTGLVQGAALGGLGTAGAMSGGLAGAAVPLVAYGAASLVANHSPLKTLLYAVQKKLPKSTYDLVAKNIEKHLARAGYFMTDGVLKHKDDEEQK